MEEKANAGSTAVDSVESSNSPVKSPVKSPAKSPAKKTSKPKSTKSQRPKSSHPPTSEMVNSAIKELKDRKGSSLQAIKKYIASTYKVDGEKLAPFIKRYLKAAVTSGAVVQTKGKGASGSFKLSTTKSSETKKIHRTVKVPKPKKIKKSVEKKTTSVRKSVSPKKPSSAKKIESVKKAAVKKSAAKPAPKLEKVEKTKPTSETKVMSKSKKTAKAPAAKTRTPKPKKTVASRTVKAPAKK
ncbi:Histone H1.1 [Eufriesea mexicana]|uniref:histone H1-like n=1 Tax=Eufriesea mexicana TaxID=516756 RepID=UPI00083C01C0|nr:PREDICTED: histone H1-like [Eufriesea mexicana]OAD59066.1 Histone H1.1 [Eufriesea mexicana]